MIENDQFDCHQSITAAAVEELADRFLPSRGHLRDTNGTQFVIEKLHATGRDLCWLYRILKEAAPHVDRIDRDVCIFYNDVVFCNKDNDPSIKRLGPIEKISQELLIDLISKIFDDEAYKEAMVLINIVDAKAELLNVWRQQLGRWIVPLGLKGSPGPFRFKRSPEVANGRTAHPRIYESW
nr:hypothetical protein [Candidatus Sigynarchaeota archaeon]